MKFEDAMKECSEDYISRIVKTVDKETLDTFVAHGIVRALKSAYCHGFEMSRELSALNEKQDEI